MNSAHISVIICTFNPRDDNFPECLDGLYVASLERMPDEIIIIDNNSDHAVEENTHAIKFISKMSAKVKIIKETIQGLTPARLRGISESNGDLLIFIDDDNVIDKSYIKVAEQIFISHPFIGAFSGQVKLKFEKEPGTWLKKYYGLLVYREFEKNSWSNLYNNADTMPAGAGLCVQKDVAVYYLNLHEQKKRTIQLDRSNGSLMSAGDNDLAMCACDIGLGVGLFKDLILIHLIPEFRTTKSYIKKLAYGIYYSGTILYQLRGLPLSNTSFRGRLKNLINSVFMNRIDREIFFTCKKSQNNAKKWGAKNLN